MGMWRKLVAFGGLLALVAATAPRASAADGGAPPVPACVAVSTASRYVPYGYNHVVVLRNGCSRAVSCSVSTDVNPERLTAEVQAGTTAEVTTFIGAASSTFVARVGCTVR
jgi:hypothetical protein